MNIIQLMYMHYGSKPVVSLLCVKMPRTSPKPEKYNILIFVSLGSCIIEALLRKLLINTEEKASLCPKELVV